MVLVAVIFILWLTVSVGTLNGLLFYANIIQANHQAYFPRVTTRVKFFTIFISWLNFDLGIETCFYDNMNIYAYSWLSIAVGSIILACRYSRSVLMNDWSVSVQFRYPKIVFVSFKRSSEVVNCANFVNSESLLSHWHLWSFSSKPIGHANMSTSSLKPSVTKPRQGFFWI